jgi:hypothetical protein
MAMHTLLSAAFAVISVVAASPQGPFTGNKLHAICNDADTKPVCAAYMLGFIQGIASERALGYPICLPKQFIPLQGAVIIMRYMNEHPDLLRKQAWIVAGAALAAQFPCPKAN